MLITEILRFVALFMHKSIPAITSSSVQEPPELHALIATIFASGATPL